MLTAWVEMLLPYFSDSESCFFTGTYRDSYGYAHGLMLERNVLRDFKRFLEAEGVSGGAWVVCAEHHRDRDILHVHALLADCDSNTRATLKSAWRESRGWSDAPELHDGGVSYCGKYALKGQDSVMFDWNLR